MPINIFEPSLQVRHPLLDYEKLQIQGTFPRPHEIPTDVFPTYSVIAGVHVDRPVGKVATFTEDNRLRTDASSGGAPAVTHSFHDTFEADTNTEYTQELSISPKSVLLFNGGIQYINYNDNTPPTHVRFWLSGDSSSKSLDLGIIPNAYDGNPLNGPPFMLYGAMPSGLNTSEYFKDDTSVTMNIEIRNVLGVISWVLLCNA